MLFIYNGKEYRATNAVGLVRAMQHDADACSRQGGTLREFLRWSLTHLANSVLTRELDIGTHLTDETLAFSYLCLLDEHGIGRLADSSSDTSSRL